MCRVTTTTTPSDIGRYTASACWISVPTPAKIVLALTSGPVRFAQERNPEAAEGREVRWGGRKAAWSACLEESNTKRLHCIVVELQAVPPRSSSV